MDYVADASIGNEESPASTDLPTENLTLYLAAVGVELTSDAIRGSPSYESYQECDTWLKANVDRDLRNEYTQRA